MTRIYIQYNCAIIAIFLLFGCSGNAPRTETSDSMAAESVNSASGIDGAHGNTADHTGSEDNYAVSDISTDESDSCNGKTCEFGQSCIEFTGFAGNQLFTCGIPCRADAPNNGCPKDMHCQVIPDGPTQCVK